LATLGVTDLLVDWSNGDQKALDRLMPLVYEELRKIARRQLGFENRGHTLQSTALVHEAYLRIVDQNRVQWRDRAHFFAVAAQMVRRVLVDHARERHAAKRGGGAQKVSLDESIRAPLREDVDLLSLNEALDALTELDAQQAKIVELRFFAGLTNSEAAEALGIGTATVQRDWVTAKAWLFDRLNPPQAIGGKIP
jgi:RNA polymerase sigma factor (TIGR02999 family)